MGSLNNSRGGRENWCGLGFRTVHPEGLERKTQDGDKRENVDFQSGVTEKGPGDSTGDLPEGMRSKRGKKKFVRG